jgi:competence protein ComEC
MPSSLAFWAGISWIQNCVALASFEQLGLLILVAISSWKYRAWPLCCLCLGLVWASLFGIERMANRLPSTLIQKEISVQGYISSLPQQHPHHQSFDFIVLIPDGRFPHKLRLNWYKAPPLEAGQSWQLSVKLKPPHGTLNPAGFDYETWLFANGFDATGYVSASKRLDNQSTFNPQQWISRWRNDLAKRIDLALPEGQQNAIIKALTLGSQNGISQSQWQLYQQTGLIHLIVISGSHISLIAGLVFVLVRKVWVRTGLMAVPSHLPAAIFSWLAGMIYGALAGFSIPTLRAVVMLSIIMLALVWQRNTHTWEIFKTAVTGVLVIDPPAVLQTGFWLSFLAVALLIHLAHGRLGKTSNWREFIFNHFASSFGLTPLLLVYFQQLSLVTPLANAIAIPLLGIIIVPVALIALILLYLLPELAHYLLMACDSLLVYLELVMQWMVQIPHAYLNLPQPSFYAAIGAGLGVLLLTTAKGFPGKQFAIGYFAPIFFLNLARPAYAEIKMTVLDVGQGLAIVIATQNHTLVYDTGSHMPDGLDMGNAVVLPYLYQQGVNKLDYLIISHGDNDHSGGAASIFEHLPVSDVLSSNARWAESERGRYCQSGQSWQWDGVEFSLLSPPATAFIKENNNSCVLQIRTHGQSILLTGDIEQEAENGLSEQFRGQLHHHILLAPHHGSKTSSTETFLAQVQPELTIVSSGYLNRFHFPHPSVVARYQHVGSRYLNTATSGAIALETDENRFSVQTQRQQQKHYWRPQDPN